jgi:protein arginine kinase activator
MICQSCGKHQAVTQIKTNINGVVTEYNLCPECAKKMGYQTTSDFYNPFLNLNSLLGSFFGKDTIPSQPVERCPVCGASFYDLSQSGKVGCAECYKIFRDQLLPSVQRMHGNTCHSGKTPTGMAMQVMPEANLTVTKEAPKEETAEEKEIRALQEKLEAAIAAQNFEEAAVLRDQIKERTQS